MRAFYPVLASMGLSAASGYTTWVIARGTFHSTGMSRFIARPGPVLLQRPHVHRSCDVDGAYSGHSCPRGSLHARFAPQPLFDSMLSETPGARQPLSAPVD